MKKLFLLAMGLSVCCCTTRQSDPDLTEMFKDKDIVYPKDAKTLVIIPDGGCGGCIAAGISFIQDNESSFSNAQRNNIVVFTKIHSMKSLKRQLGIPIEKLNSIVDTTRIFSIDAKEGVYPIILYLDNGNITSVDIASPETDAFGQLRKNL